MDVAATLAILWALKQLADGSWDAEESYEEKDCNDRT